MKKTICRIVSLILAVVLIFGQLPAGILPVRAAEVPQTNTGLEGKTISILGDSISTYTGISNNTSYNSTIGSNAIYYTEGKLSVYQKDTWWQQAIDALGLELLVNNSWSGSCILHTRSGTVGAYVDRCVQLHNDHTGEEPDIIAVFMGTNDFSYYQSALGTAQIDYDSLIRDNGDGTFTYGTPTTSCEAYAIMLHKMTQRYPNAEVYCMNLLARRNPVNSGADVGQPTAFNAALAEIIERYGATLVDLENCGITSEPSNFDLYMGDKRVHPSAAGMDKMTEALVSAMLGKTAQLCHITGNYGGVANSNTAGVALMGGSYSAKLSLQPGHFNMQVTVTMGGADITASAYANGVISIPNVTGDLVITAKADREPANFRWEFDGTDLVSVGNTENTLTKLAGSTNGSVFSNTRYQMAGPVILRHNLPWIVEWKGEGTGGFMLANASNAAATPFFFRRAGNYLNAFGSYDGSQYNNYGIALSGTDIDGSANHVYRLENRIAADGSNMVWLSVDGVGVGALNQYYVAGSAKGTTGDWINGKDFTFSHIGTTSHPLTNYAMEYLQVWEAGEPIEGKTISILGASISTYTGISNNTDYNSTIGSNAIYYTEGRHGVYAADTWWMQAADDLGLELLVNNSWSGSSLLHERNGTVGAYVDRCVQLHNNDGEVPDIIGIQMGTNDFQYYKDTLGTADINYDTLIADNGDGTYTYATPLTSLEAAAIVLHKISVRYPNAEVYYLNISQRIDGTDELIRAFNAELKQVVEHFGAHIVDIYGSAITMDNFDTYIGDGKVHPNCLGMDAYTEAFKRALIENTAYAVKTHTVTMNLDGVTADYGDDKIVVDGDRFTLKLTAADSLQVTVTMGGQDITQTACTGGTVTIDSVTDDVTITAKSVHESKDYRWEFDGSDLACVEGSNALTKTAGTTTDGVFSKTSYSLTAPVVLLHDQPWAVEWKCSGTFLNANGSSGARIFTSDNVNANYNARYIFKSNTNGIIAMGEKDTAGSHNYGIALADHGIDWTALHTYRLENRIAEDGSNMIWLSVDGEEIGPMNHYYLGTKDQKTTSNWLSGKDFVFPYMGTDTHGFTNASIAYIHVNECTHTYENGICTGCGEAIPQPKWEQGSIGAANGLEKDYANVIRTADYLRLSDYVGMTLNADHYITYFVYDANHNYLGNGKADLTANFLLSGQGISTHEMRIHYPEGEYFRIALWRGKNGEMTPDMLDGADVKFLDGSQDPVFWEMGSIYAASGLAFVREQVIRSVNYLPVEDYAGVTVADGYAVSFLAYDENLNYLGNGNPEKKGYFIPSRVTMQEIVDQYPDTKYIRLLLVEDPLADLTIDAVELSDIRLYKAGETVPEKTYPYQGLESSFEVDFAHGLLDANNGTYHSTDSGFVTTTALPLKHISKITWAKDYVLLWTAYNAQNDYLGSSASYLTSGEVTKADILAVYSEASYIAVSVKPASPKKLELAQMAKESGLAIHHDLSQTGSIAHDTVMQAQKSQDGAIYNDTLFLFDKYGQCTVYDTGSKAKLGSFTLDKIDVLNPHANSVCFSDVYYEQGDPFPLLYVNIYNNYWTTNDPKEGTCCVYRIFEENGTYSTKLVQVLKIGFTDDYDLWNSAEGNGYHYYLPYGNFIVDTDANKLWAFVLRNGDDQTRFFQFDLPDMSDGTFNESYGCNLVTLAASDIEDMFDLEHFEILQGCTYANGKIYSANGLGTSSSYNPFAELKVVDLRSKSVAAVVDFSTLGFGLEPEMISFNVGGDEQLYYLSIDGVLRKLRFVDATLSTAPVVDRNDHTYKNGICTGCGAEHPNLTNYEGKVISILGDSISTFAGYIPVADGFNLTHLARYPQDNLLTDVNETWWMQTIAELDGKLGINDSWRGSTVSGYPSVTTGVAGYLAAMSNLTQIQNLGSNGTPDVILFYGGTNDLAHTPSLGTFDPATAPTEVDLTTLKWNNLADAYAQILLRLKHFYPNTQIICLLPTYTTSYYSNDKLAQGNALMASICQHYGVTYIDLRDCGISTADLPDGIHPDATGMDYITNAVLETLLAQNVESGENIVHSVTHDLTGVTSSLGYYKGVSDGKAFVTTLTGDDMTVSVTMGGMDITAQVYADGVITIPAVTGDLVITAAGRVKPIYEDHLQQLPDPYYGVDLWKTLEHDDEYFYIDAWTVHSSGNVYSVTFPVTPGDKIVASSFGAAGSNGATMNGIRVTWFDADGVLHSVGAADVYAEFEENGYLTVPEGAVAVNIPMWTNANQWELYVYDSSYEPTFSLGDHLQQLPENVCAGTNLWDVLQPENTYYTGSAWGNLTTNQVWSVTIAVTAGDQIWATSFQKYGSNGNNFNTTNGIRITWFGANGVLKSVSPAETYQEFAANGYITVPEGAVAVNIPMWSGSDSNELYVLSLAHVPGDPVVENQGAHGSHDVVIYCEICGAELSREQDDGYLPGDINGDGEVNNKDLTRLFQYLSDYDVEVVEEALDLNGDGSVNNKDLTRLFQYLSDYEVELH